STKLQIKQEYKETQKKLLNEIIALGDGDISLVEYDPFNPISVAGFFDSDFMFNIKDGFDIVIGNPPYISALTDSKNEFSVKLRVELKKHYIQLSGQFDLYIPFLLNSINLLNKNGIFSWIIPNKFLVAKYAQKSYDFLANNGLFQIISCSHLNVFENASVYPIILLGSKGQSRKIFKYKAESFRSFLSQDFLVESKQEANNSILIKDTELRLSSGMTGFMAQSIIPLINSENFSENNIPFIVSGNIDRYAIDFNTVKYMKSTYKNPKILLDNNIISKGKIELWLKPKIIIAGMTKVIEAIYVENPIAIGVGVYAINNFSNYLPKFLVAVLNSKFLTYYLQTNFKEKHLAGGYLAINKNTIEQLPLPLMNIFDEQQKIFEILVDYVMYLKALPNEQKIDEYVSNEHIAKQFEEVID
ncbi:MAG: Eco57I restriction-modification methylase domain-containing protein, partial [Epsilonproteobacteria bacterium]|nr:Eco57I restriction-modification methylase domain-containing protein [Campylobacterota bacterium]